MITNDNNINFTAKLDLSNVKSNKRMWNQVAQMFEEKTHKTPYTFNLDDSDGVIDIYAHTNTKLQEIEHSCTLSKTGTNELINMTPEKITNKLVKLLNIFKSHDKTTNTGLECLNKLGKNDKYDTLTTCERGQNSIFDRIYWAVTDKAKADRTERIAKDPIFKNAEFLD